MNQSVNSLQSENNEFVFGNFRDKVVLVTGSAHGIGRAICQSFVHLGAVVVATDYLEDALSETKMVVQSLIKEQSLEGNIETFNCDLTSEEEVDSLIKEIVSRHRKIDVLVNVAGGVAGQVHQPIEQVSTEEWDRVVNINLKAVFYTIRAVAPFMKKRHYGRIVNISSGAGRSSSLTGIQAYTSSKAGQIGLTRQMARELGPYGITVNNVAPGFILSNPSTQKQWDNMTDQEKRGLVESISVKRLGKPEEIAYPVLFFASDSASYISGQIISADGGLQLF